MGKATSELMDQIHGSLADHFTDVLLNGEQISYTDKETGEVCVTRVKPTAATLAQIRQFLKDNHIEVAAGKSKRVANLAAVLPFAGAAEG